MTIKGFPLLDSAWYFSKNHQDRKWIIQIHYASLCVVDVSATSEALAIKRAWDALEEYCRTHQ